MLQNKKGVRNGYFVPLASQEVLCVLLQVKKRSKIMKEWRTENQGKIYVMIYVITEMN